MTSQIHILSASFEARGSGWNVFPLAHSPHKDKGTVGPSGFRSHLSDTCQVLAGILLQKHFLFYFIFF